MNGPILSIITVNFNNNLGLLKTLESVSSQSFSSYEHIIIDAGSTDGSRETIIQYEKENPHLSFWSSESDKGIYDGMVQNTYTETLSYFIKEKLKKEYTQTHWISYIYQIIHYTINHVLYIIPCLKIKDMTLITKSYLIGHIVSSAL